MKAEAIGRALHAVGVGRSASRLLTHMAWRCDDDGVFYESRTTTCNLLGMGDDMVKRCLRELVRVGYISDVLAARPGRNSRHVQLHPDRWEQPTPLTAARGVTLVSPRNDGQQPGPERARQALREAARAARP